MFKLTASNFSFKACYSISSHSTVWNSYDIQECHKRVLGENLTAENDSVG